MLLTLCIVQPALAQPEIVDPSTISLTLDDLPSGYTKIGENAQSDAASASYLAAFSIPQPTRGDPTLVLNSITSYDTDRPLGFMAGYGIGFLYGFLPEMGEFRTTNGPRIGQEATWYFRAHDTANSNGIWLEDHAVVFRVGRTVVVVIAVYEVGTASQSDAVALAQVVAHRLSATSARGHYVIS